MTAVALLPDAERTVRITEAAARLSVPPVIVEKDFWVCWLLGRIFSRASPPSGPRSSNRPRRRRRSPLPTRTPPASTPTTALSRENSDSKRDTVQKRAGNERDYDNPLRQPPTYCKYYYISHLQLTESVF